ncbi:hypothetical protein O6H91_Y184000 [Diphasiastrum complanatum]|nr:hypothetical protein O6H91_Y184000 [Diphasiastrum complanatum]
MACSVENCKPFPGSKGSLEVLLMALDSCSDVSGSDTTLCREEKRKMDQINRASKKSKKSSSFSVSPKQQSDLAPINTKRTRIGEETRDEPSECVLEQPDVYQSASEMTRNVAFKELSLFERAISRSSSSEENQISCTHQASAISHQSITGDENLRSMKVTTNTSEIITSMDQSKICLRLSIGGDTSRLTAAQKPVQTGFKTNITSETDLSLDVCPTNVVGQQSATLKVQTGIYSAEEIRGSCSHAPDEVKPSTESNDKCLSLFPIEAGILRSSQHTELNSIPLLEALGKKGSDLKVKPVFKPGIIRKPRDKKQVHAFFATFLATIGMKDLDSSIGMPKTRGAEEPTFTLRSWNHCKSLKAQRSECIKHTDEIRDNENAFPECNSDIVERHSRHSKSSDGEDISLIKDKLCSQILANKSIDIQISSVSKDTSWSDATQVKYCKQKISNAYPESCNYSRLPREGSRLNIPGDLCADSGKSSYSDKQFTTMDMAPDKTVKNPSVHETPYDRQSDRCGNRIQNGDHTNLSSFMELLPRCGYSMPELKNAANFAAKWLELLRLDIKGRLSALKRSKQRVRGIVVSCQLGIENAKLSLLHTRDTKANLAHSCCKQQSVISTRDFNKIPENTVIQDHELQTLQHWSSLFSGMDFALSLEREKLESWLKNIQDVQSKCRAIESQEKHKAPTPS